MLCWMLLAPLNAAHADARAVEGTWVNGDGDGLIAISVDGGSISASILGSVTDDPERPDTDVRNPNPKLRSRKLVGLEIFSGFSYDGDGEWSGGFIYDPNSGKTYRCTLKLLDLNTLKVRGFIGISLIGRTETWRRR